MPRRFPGPLVWRRKKVGPPAEQTGLPNIGTKRIRRVTTESKNGAFPLRPRTALRPSSSVCEEWGRLQSHSGSNALRRYEHYGVRIDLLHLRAHARNKVK